MTSIEQIVKGLAKKAGDEMGALVTYDSMPAIEPPYPQAIVIQWEQTTVNGSNYATQQGKRLMSNADVRVHEGTLLWLYAASSNALVETGKAYEEAQKLLDVFRKDIRLEDATGQKLADKVSITLVQPIETQWGQTVYFGIQAEWEAMELL